MLLLFERVLGILLCLWLSRIEASHFSSQWAAADIIPSRMLGTHLDEEIHVAKVKVGTDPRTLRLAIDFSGRSLIISSAPGRSTGGDTGTSDPADWSSSYSTAAGGSDVIHLSGHVYRLPVIFNPSAAVIFGCPTCHGVLGVGPGSPLWLLWGKATFSSGSISLGKAVGSVSDQGSVRIACDPLSDDLCSSKAEVYGVIYDVRFRFQSAFTVVPSAVYDAYVGTRSLSTTSVASWPSLAMKFESADAPVDTRIPRLRIAPQSLVADSRHSGARTLLLRRNPDPASTEIILGRSTWRSMMLFRDFRSGHAVIHTFDSTKRWPTWALVVVVIAVFGVARWWMTRDALFYESSGTSRPNTTVKAIAGRLPFGASSVYRPNTVAYAGGRATRSPVPPRSLGTYPGEWGVYPDRFFVSLAAIPAAIATLYIPAFRNALQEQLEFWIFMQIITYASVAWVLMVWMSRLAGRADAFGVLRYKASARSTDRSRQSPSFAIFRAGLIQQASIDVLLSVVLVMLSTLTRTDSLGNTMIMVASGILAGVVMYHFMAGIIHATRFNYRFPVGQKGKGIWVLWMLYGGLLSLLVAVFVAVFVMIPFLQLHITSAGPVEFLLGAMVIYVLGLYLAFVLADSEATRMQKWIDRHRKLQPTTTPVMTSSTAAGAGRV